MAYHKYTYTIEEDCETSQRLGGRWWIANITDPRGNSIVWRRKAKYRGEFDKKVKAKIKALNDIDMPYRAQQVMTGHRCDPAKMREAKRTKAAA